MDTIAYILVGVVIVLHMLFLILEMFLWTKPIGRKTFSLSQQKANETAVLAANQGLYNGFLAAGLVWGLFFTSQTKEVLLFFLSCIIIAGVFGAVTANRAILWLQAFPALLALVVLVISGW